jgi:gamma-glutamylcyclotransferase
MKPLYFAYGSNLDTGQMRLRCPGAAADASAVLRGYTLAFAGHSSRWGGAVATLARKPGAVVEGLLYRVPRRELAILDLFEGCPFVYDRVRVSVKDALGRRRRAQAYVLAPSHDGSAPGVAYVQALVRAYGRLGFDRRPLLAAALGSAA